MPSRSLIGPRRTALALLAALVLGGCASDKSTQAQPAELVEFKPTLTVRTTWQASVGAARGAYLQPGVAENAIYAAAANGTLVRLAPDTGREVWRIDTGASLTAGVGTDGFVVVVATQRGEVLAFDADGKPRWRAQVTSDVTTPPLVGRGAVIVRSTDQRVSSFGSEDGKRRWTFQRAQPPLTLRVGTEMAFSGENVLVGFPGGRLIAIALANGAARWELAIAEPRGTTEVERLTDVIGAVAVAGADACAAAFQGRITCAAAASGVLRWTRDLPAGNGVAVDAGSVYGVDAASHVVAFGREAGASLWRNDKLAQRGLTTPLALPSALVVADRSGYVHFLAPGDGQFLARLRLGSSAITVAPRAWAGAALLQTQDGTVALLTPER